jgi:RNA polymerase sigma-70 factor (ECF subfamily)
MTAGLPSDAELVERLCAGDNAAFETLFDRHHDSVQRYLARTVRDPGAVEDLTQEAFLRVWTRAEQWHGSGSFKSWLLRIAANLMLNHLRSVRRRRELPLELPADLGDTEPTSSVPAWMVDAAALGPDAALERAEEQRQLHRLMEHLPEEKREVLRLVHDAQMEVEEVAATLGIPPGTVRSRLHYARKHLARAWEDSTTEGENPDGT